MKRLICLIVAASLLLALSGCYDEPGRTVRWTLEDDVLTVTDSDPLSTPDPYTHTHDVVRDDKWNSLADRIHTLRLDSSVAAIGSGAFAAMPVLETVEWSDRLAYIGNGAFSGSGLKLESLPESLVKIGKAAFSGCTLPEEFVIPANIQELGPGVFSACTGVKSVRFEGSIDTLGFGLFSETKSLESARLPEGLVQLPSEFFASCENLREVILPDSVKRIERKAFSGCTALESIAIPSGTETISSHAFENCTALKQVTLNEGLTQISEWAFQSCTALEQILLPSTLTELAQDSFVDCTALTKFSVAEGNPRFSSDDTGLIYTEEQAEKTLFLVPPGLTGTLHVPQGTQCFDSWSFRQSRLSTVILPDSVIKIHRTAFESSRIEDLYIPTSVTSIGHRIFSGCGNLKHIFYAGTRQQFEQIEGSEEFLTDYGGWLVCETPAP